ncbi:hypothetical protein [Polaromonas sp. CG9_12]|nr:hypothetical protein [Polaromonas sp. CG9_12]
MASGSRVRVCIPLEEAADEALLDHLIDPVSKLSQPTCN